MWYYVKEDNKQEGPISDPALVKLIKEGAITPSTLVWTQTMKNWAELKNTNFYKKALSSKKNYNLESFKLKTYLLRALMWALITLLGYKIYIIVNTMTVYTPDLISINSEEELKELITFKEGMLMLKLIDIVQKALFLSIFVMFAIWILNAINNTKKATSQLMMSPYLAVIGSIIPFANIILIPAILKRIYRTLEVVIRKRRHIVSHIFVKTWMFVWFMGWISMIYNTWGISLKANLHLTEDVYYFKVYNCSLQIFLLLTTMIFVSVISRQIKRIQRHS